MTQRLKVDVPRSHDVLSRLDAAFVAGNAAMTKALRETAGARQEAAETYRVQRRDDRLAMLRLRESLLHAQDGAPHAAFDKAHEAWLLVQQSAPPHVQALVLTQLGACYQHRGDLRGALRAVRRAEALLASVAPEGTPQMLAVRAQLVALLQLHGAETAAAVGRRDRSWRLLGQTVRNADQARRHRRFRQVFVVNQDPPSWAFTYHRKWRNVHDE